MPTSSGWSTTSTSTNRRRIPRTVWGRWWDNIKWLFGFDADHTGGRHGFEGWLHTSVTDLELGLSDKQLVKMIKAALWTGRLGGPRTRRYARQGHLAG